MMCAIRELAVFQQEEGTLLRFHGQNTVDKTFTLVGEGSIMIPHPIFRTQSCS